MFFGFTVQGVWVFKFGVLGSGFWVRGLRIFDGFGSGFIHMKAVLEEL